MVVFPDGKVDYLFFYARRVGSPPGRRRVEGRDLLASHALIMGTSALRKHETGER